MFSKKIKFIATEESMLDAWPHPKPASRYIPDEYKKLERFINGDIHKGTVKTCIPFLDSLTAGYIIPFDQDYVVDPAGDDFSVKPANFMKEEFEFHYQYQLPPEWHDKVGIVAGKLHNKWLIKTPPGYSCLFIKPMNRIESRIDVIAGVVDTDTYGNNINFPFFLNKRDEQFVLKKGEPMVQVIPFKRESWKMWSGFYVEKLHQKTLNMLNTKFVDRYKTMFWQKKSFK